MGLVAFTLFAIDSIEASNLDEDIIEIFDFIHMAIFIITVLYTVFCGLILYLSTVTGRKWKYLEDIDIHNYINLKNQCDSINDTMGLERDQVCFVWQLIACSRNNPCDVAHIVPLYRL